jgi:phage tail-like protein
MAEVVSMSVRATPVDLRQKYQWALEIAGFDSAYFTECDSPSSEIEVVMFAGAGTVHDIQNPGRRKFTAIVAKKGMYLGGPDTAAFDWFTQAADTDTGQSLPPSQLKRDVDLHHLDGDGNVIETWTLKGAWISKLEYEKLEGKSSDFLFEMLTITYDRYERQ